MASFTESQETQMIKGTAEEIASEFPPEYWREKEEKGEFANGFWDELSKAGFNGLLVPEEHGGAGMGMQEMGVAMETLCSEGCGMAGTWYLVLSATMAATGLIKNGSEEQKEEFLPDLARGDVKFSIGITEPDAGTNTLNVDTYAEKEGDEWVINGKKAWITFSDISDYIILVTRTKPRDEVERSTQGITLFIAPLDDSSITVSPIPKHGINYSNSCEVFIEDLTLTDSNILGEEGDGWWALIDTLNPERIAFSAAATGIGRLASSKAIDYSNNRQVFDDPIGRYQGIQFPITEAYSRMECASIMREKAAWLYDNDKDCAYETNIAKSVAVDAGIDAVYNSMQTFGGWGYAKEYDVERWWREINLIRLAPVTQQMAYNHTAQKIGFPKSY